MPENRDDPSGRILELEVVILRARAERPRRDPLFVIPGGPGQSATRSAGPRSYFASVFDGVRQDRDVVLVAPRGTAGAGELALEPPPELLFDDMATVIPASWAAQARPRLEEQADLRQYTTSHLVDDLETIRRVLGYGRLNLYGTSYGTRVAQLFGVRYPESVRAMILKAPVPPSVPVPLTYTAGPERALRRLFELCRREEACARAYPRLEERFSNLMARLASRPQTLSVRHPMTGDTVEVALDDRALGYALRNMMMSASGGATALAVVHRSELGDFRLVAEFLPRMRASYATALAGGMTISVIASEDVPRVTAEDLDADEARGFLKGAVARGMVEAGRQWPRGDVPPDRYEPLRGPVPVLLVAGDLDPATPPEFAEEIAASLPRSLTVVFRGGAHSANNFTGLDGIMTQFVEQGGVEGLDLTAAEENRPVSLAPSGP